MRLSLAFGPFRIDRGAGILFHGDQPAPLGQRAVALLALLVEQAGKPVSKQALIEAAWPAQAVEDSNLTVQIAAVRRVLETMAGGGRWIETLPRRGYRYVGPEVAIDGGDAEQATASLELPGKPSVAVLPFSNMSGDPGQDYFTDGVVDDIITGLARINWLFVIARNSSFTYKGRAVDVKQVGRELGVRYVLEGSVRKVGNRVRITGQLIDAEDGGHLWAERYDRDLTDVFALQDEITISVVAAIEPNLRRAEIERVRRKRPDSLDAYDLLLRALPDVYTFMPQGAAKGLPLLDRALAIEPSYALAHGFAAWTHQTLFIRGGMSAEHREKSSRHAHAAIEHGSGDAMALALAGFTIGLVEHDRRLADEAFSQALSLSASCAFVYAFGCVPVAYGGDAQRAIDWCEQAMRLSPLDAMRCVPQGIVGFANFLAGRHEQAVAAGRRAVEMTPGFSILHGWLAAPLARLGRIEEAKAAGARLMALDPHFFVGRWSAAVGLAPAIRDDVTDALRQAGLPA